MSRFNHSNLNKTANEWGAQALRENLSDRSGHLIVAGIVGGGLLASATTPLLGGVLALYCVVKGIQSAFAADKNKKLITGAGCVAHVLKSSDFRAYRRQVGEAKIMEELHYAEDEGMPLSIDAWEFLDETAHQPLLTKHQSTKSNVIDVPAMPIIQIKEGIEVERYHKETELVEFKTETPDLPSYLARSLKLSLIVGVPGSGKGIFVSNALEAVKRFHSGTTVFYIDPKNDPKETAYFSGRVDKLFRKDLMTCEPEEAAQWVKDCLGEYDRFDCNNDRKLLVFDELNLTLKTLKGVKVDKGEQSPLEWFKTKLTGYSSSGDSRGIVLWGISQNAHVSGLGLDGGDRTMFVPVFIVDSRNISASEGILKAQMIPSDKRLNSTQIQQLCNKSEIGRAIFFGGNNEWYPMPKLENYSGFDRDSRSFLDGFAPPPKGERLANNYEAIGKLENAFKSDSPTIVENALSESAQQVLEYFTAALKKEPKSVRDLKQSIKLRALPDTDLLMALLELVRAKELKFDIEGSYLRPDW